MSKQWYYEVMGTVIGPLTAVELKQRVLKGQVQADTPVRMGADGRWQAADRVKGLMDRTDAPATAAAPKPVSAPAPKAVAPAAKPSATVAAPAPKSEPTHVAGDTPARETLALDDPPPQDYDFFRFVGFDTAIGTPLHDVLDEHCRRNHLTLTQATRIALAHYLNRKDLLEPVQAGDGVQDTGGGVQGEG